jgi:hypothetical protein
MPSRTLSELETLIMTFKAETQAFMNAMAQCHG